ncbi:MAG: hypothetical protein FWH01_02530 [Oscillospiraceae bacterium]|nr:hypothetical protein [Oscillospiraceae bacterium]
MNASAVAARVGGGSSADIGGGANTRYTAGSADTGANADTGAQRALPASPSKALYAYDGYEQYEYDNFFAYDYYHTRYVQPTPTPSPAPTPTPAASNAVSGAGGANGTGGSAAAGGSGGSAGAAAAGTPTPIPPSATSGELSGAAPLAATPSPTPTAAILYSDQYIDDSMAPAAAAFGADQILERLIERIGQNLADADVIVIELEDAVPAELADLSELTEMAEDDESPEGALPGAALLVLINMTNPNGDEVEIVYKNTYSICGVRDDDADPEEPVIIFLTRFDAETGAYTEFADVDGEAQWTVGSNGVFTRSVLLEEGENHFAIAACTASVIEAAQTEGRYIEDHEIQVVTFTILYRSQNVTEKISELLKELTIANILKEIDNH